MTAPDMFADIPFLLGEIRGSITPEASPPSGMPSGSGTPLTVPISLSAVDDADELYAAIVVHAQAVAQELGMSGPLLLHRKAERGPLGFPSGTTPNAAIRLGRNGCRFIEHHLEYISNDLADEVYTDLKRRHSWLATRYRTNAEAEQLAARCPECSCLSVYKKPPKAFRDPEVFHCRTCMNVLTEAETYKQCELREKELKARKGRKRGKLDLTTAGS